MSSVVFFIGENPTHETILIISRTPTPTSPFTPTSQTNTTTPTTPTTPIPRTPDDQNISPIEWAMENTTIANWFAIASYPEPEC